MKTETMTISQKALQVIALVKNAIQSSPTGVSFFSLKNYTNKFGEVTDNLINIGINYETSKKQDIEFLENINLTEHEFKSTQNDIVDAKRELIEAFLKPDENRSNGQIEAYEHICKGVKVHKESGLLYIYGYRVSKKVIKEGNYPKVNSKALTIAKNELRKLLKTGKFTQYSIEVGNTLKAKGETIEL